MSTANLDIVRRMVYENLGITLQGTGVGEGYGNYKDNQRYPELYVDDAIANADITVMKTLLKSKQYHFSEDFFAADPVFTNPHTLPSNIELLSIYFKKGSSSERGTEIPWEMYEMFTGYDSDSLFPLEDDAEGPETVRKYAGYFCIKDHALYHIPFEEFPEEEEEGDEIATLKYIALPHPGTLEDLRSPESFEEAIAFLASANLLMKRADNPPQATYYLQQFQAMMGLYLTPSTNQQRTIDQ